ncbi:MAG: methylated-DNA--[protein]-cysteine S-methyltransferase [Chloroflexaceae bacterium]|nr:methylated-DNA--[protein]-cysteine S-methyltransferase [Chloroflexaceae bacterium]
MAQTTYTYMITDSPLGCILLNATQQGVCHISIGDTAIELENNLLAQQPTALRATSDRRLQQWLQLLTKHLDGEQPELALPIDVAASAFQWQVWHALQAIPYGETRSYGALARQLNQPQASRAVGHACASNPVALVIPCHRAVRANGDIGGYRWGVTRKRALLDREHILAGQRMLLHSG